MTIIYFKINVKDGWVNRETGKKSDPQITFQDAKLLADVLPTFAKKLSIQLNIQDLHPNLIQKLNEVFKANSGDNPVSFEVIETEIIEKPQEVIKPTQPVIILNNEEEIDIENLDVNDTIDEEELVENEVIAVDQVRRITTLEMPSRKLKVKITKELLDELTQIQINFKLN